MKTSKFYLTIVSLIALLVSNAVAAAWTGSMSEPENMKKIDGKAFYVITTADELAWFADQVNGGKSTINAVLGNDIVFGKDKNTVASVNWTPIGKDTKLQFAGILDGAGYTIYGLSSTGLSLAGLIGVLNTNGVVRNMKTNAGYISGKFRVGGIVAHSNGLIQDVENNNKVEVSYKSGDSTVIYVGGIAAHNQGTIIDCSNKASVSNTALEARSGGIAGYNTGKIENSGNSGSISAITVYAGVKDENKHKVYSGGIVGYNAGSINKTRNVGSIFAKGYYVYTYSAQGGQHGWYEDYTMYVYSETCSGGISGFSTTVIINSINNGEISNYNKTNDNGYTDGIVASGKAKNSIDLKTLKYWLNETEIQGTAENMQKDQFAWILNTTNGLETNSGMWTRTTGYPDFAKDSNLAIYRVVFNDGGATSNRYTNYKGLVTFPENPEPAEDFIFKGWYNSEDIKVKPSTVFTADQTVNAVYVEASGVYWTINFFNTDSKTTLLQTKQYQHGSIVSYEGEIPTKETTAQYTYTFKGWNVEPTNAIDDFDYYAVYDSVVRSYTIVFNNFDGSKIESGSFKYGAIPSCSKTPTRTATAEWTYSHKGWKPALDYVTGEATYVATYDSSKVEYKVTFMNGVDVIDEQMVPYGEAAVAPTDVTRDGYKFTGWNTSFSKVTENLTVKALFEELPSYIVKVVDGNNGAKIDSTKVVEGKVYTLPTAPKKTAYTFDAYYDGEKKLGVANDEVTIISNITITAAYKRKIPTLRGNLVQTLTPGDTFKTVIFQGVDTCYRKTSNISFLKVSTGGSLVDIKGIVPVLYKGDSIIVDSLLVNTNVYEIKVTIRIPNEPKSSSSAKSSSSSKVSSSSKAVSSSSMNVKSSSSKKTNAIIVTGVPKFSMIVQNRFVQISNARIGSAYALFDMQGRVLQKGRVENTNYSIVVPRAGAYFVRIDDQIKKVNVR